MNMKAHVPPLPAPKTAPRPAAVEPAPGPGTLAGLRRGWVEFWFSPTSSAGLHALRLLGGLLFVAWLLPLTPARAALFGPEGWFDYQAYLDANRLPGGAPVPIGWSLLFLAGASPVGLELMWWGSLAVFTLFALGLWTRITGVLTWVLVVSYLASPAALAEADFLLAILAFYLMVGYLLLGQWDRPLTLLERVLGPRGTSVFAGLMGKGDADAPSVAANLTVRLVQVHFAVIVVTSALHKFQFGDWWSGIALWYPLHPPFQTDAERLRAEVPSRDAILFWLSLAQYVVLAWQLSFPLFAFRRRWRPILLGGVAAAWLGAALLYHEPMFGPAFAVMCLSYLSPEEWRRLAGLVTARNPKPEYRNPKPEYRNPKPIRSPKTETDPGSD
jgi:hypothetical protein